MGILNSLIGLPDLSSVASAAGDITKTVGDVLGKFIPDANVKLQAQEEMQKVLAESQKAQYDAMAQVMSADSASDSKYTKNARPTVVYWSLAMITGIAVAGFFGHATPVITALAAAPDKLYDMITYGIGIYAAGRSTEKVAGVAGDVIKSVLKRK